MRSRVTPESFTRFQRARHISRGYREDGVPGNVALLGAAFLAIVLIPGVGMGIAMLLGWQP